MRAGRDAGWARESLRPRRTSPSERESHAKLANPRVLTLALYGEEREELVFLERPAHRSTELLTAASFDNITNNIVKGLVVS